MRPEFDFMPQPQRVQLQVSACTRSCGQPDVPTSQNAPALWGLGCDHFEAVHWFFSRLPGVQKEDLMRCMLSHTVALILPSSSNDRKLMVWDSHSRPPRKSILFVLHLANS